jgi:hypothetical protein
VSSSSVSVSIYAGTVPSKNMSPMNIVILLLVVVMTTNARSYYDAIVGEYNYDYYTETSVISYKKYHIVLGTGLIYAKH